MGMWAAPSHPPPLTCFLPAQTTEAPPDLRGQHCRPPRAPGALSLHGEQPQDPGGALPVAGLPRRLPHKGVSWGRGVSAGPAGGTDGHPPHAQVLCSRGGQEGEDEQTRPDLWGQAAHPPGGACTGEDSRLDLTTGFCPRPLGHRTCAVSTAPADTPRPPVTPPVPSRPSPGPRCVPVPPGLPPHPCAAARGGVHLLPGPL